MVLIHGSGSSDKDETVGALKPFRDLAEGLADGVYELCVVRGVIGPQE